MWSQLNKKNMNSLKFNKKKNFINQIKYAEHKIFCICIDVYKIHEFNDFGNAYEVLSILKKLKINNILIEKSNDMLENPDFEQDYYSKTAIGIYRKGQASIRLTKWLKYFDRSFYKNLYYYDLMGTVLKSLNEIS